MPLANLLIEQFEWRGAYLVLAMLCLFLLLPLMVFGLRKPPTAPKQRGQPSAAPVAPGRMLRNPLFWALMIVGLTALGPVRSLTVHQVAYMESAGVTRATAANIVGFAGLLTSLAFIGLGWVSDRFGRFVAFGIGASGLIGAVGMLLLMRAEAKFVVLIAYALCFALGEGTRSSQSTALASDVFQRQGLGLINGLMGRHVWIGRGAGDPGWSVGCAMRAAAMMAA